MRESSGFDEEFHDVAAQRPHHAIVVDEVRVFGQRIPLLIDDPLLAGARELMCDVTAGVSLDAGQRGIHMSRMERALSAETRTLPGAAYEIAEAVRVLQDQDFARVSLSATAPLRTTTRVTGQRSPDTVELAASATVGPEPQVAVSLSATNILACPCMQTYTLEELAGRLGLAFDDARGLLSRVPIATHSQRGRVRLEVLAQRLDGLPTYLALYEIANRATVLTQELLKRPDEYDVIRRAHFNAQFVEDVARALTAELLRELRSGPAEPGACRFVDVVAESHESIHSHDISAHIRAAVD